MLVKFKSHEDYECDYCGRPYFEGEEVVQDTNTDKIYCSKRCAEIDNGDRTIITELAPYGL